MREIKMMTAGDLDGVSPEKIRAAFSHDIAIEFYGSSNSSELLQNSQPASSIYRQVVIISQ